MVLFFSLYLCSSQHSILVIWLFRKEKKIALMTIKAWGTWQVLRIHTSCKAQLESPLATTSWGDHHPEHLLSSNHHPVHPCRNLSCRWRDILERRHPCSFIPAQPDCITLPGQMEFHIAEATQPLQTPPSSTNCWLEFWFPCWGVSFLRHESQSLFWFLYLETVPCHCKNISLRLQIGAFPPHLHFSAPVMIDVLQTHEE